MEDNKSYIEALFNNLARIILVTILFLIFRYTTHAIVMRIDFIAKINWLGWLFYLHTLEVIILLLIFKYGFNKEDKIGKVNEKKNKVSMLDILIFLFIGLLLFGIFTGGLIYLENFIGYGPKYEEFVAVTSMHGVQMTNLERIYIFMAGVVLVPAVEELFLRKGVFQYFADKEVRNINIILISGISFGLWHYSGGPAKIVGSIIAGIIFAIMYATTKNVIYPIIGHGINNFMQTIISGFIEISDIVDVESYIEYTKFTIRGFILISLILLIITSTISYLKRKTIISSDFKNQLRKVLTE